MRTWTALPNSYYPSNFAVILSRELGLFSSLVHGQRFPLPIYAGAPSNSWVNDHHCRSIECLSSEADFLRHHYRQVIFWAYQVPRARGELPAHPKAQSATPIVDSS